MAEERPHSTWRDDTLADKKSETRYPTEAKEYDHLSAPQFTDQCGSSQYPEAVDKSPHSFAESSSEAARDQNRQNVHEKEAAPLSWKRKNKRILVSGIVALAIIVAAATGALGGYFDSKNSNRDANNKNSSTTSTSTPQSHPNYHGSPDNSTDVGSGPSSTPTSRPADALNGTAMATVAYDAAEKYSADTTSENYLLFYQHSNGDIRRLTYNQSEWHPSEFVTSDARVGTGLSIIQFGAVPTQIYMYYIDKLGYLQELRGTHGSNEWINGTLGTRHFKTVDTYSALSANYLGDCGARGNIDWVYYESEKGIQEALWAHDQDTWSAGALISDHTPGSDFWTSHDKSPINAWRMYDITKNRRIQEHYCLDCCSNATTGWTTGLNGSMVDNSTLGLAATMVNGSRILYYQNMDSKIIMELNNTDVPTGSKAEYVEAWTNDPSPKGTDNNITNGSGSSTLTKAMVGSKLSVAQGFKGLTRQLFLFYQNNGSDITWRIRNEHDTGQWTDPTSLDVEI